MPQILNPSPQTCGAKSEDLAILARGVSRRFGQVKAVADASLTLPRGACSILIGTNGAGKTTLFRLLQGMQTRDGGDLAVLGLDPTTDGGRLRANIGYVPEDGVLGQSWMTVERLISHHRAYYPAWDHDYAEHLSRRLSIKRDRRLSQLSKGQARRIQLVLAMAHRPALLLLDEPTDGLDPIVRSDVLSLLAEHLADTGCSTLISTHIVHEFQGIADRLAVIKRGTVCVDIERDALLANLRSYRGVVPTDWVLPPRLAPHSLRVEVFGRERRWILNGNPKQTREVLTDSGVTLSEVMPLTLEEAALVLLRSEPST